MTGEDIMRVSRKYAGSFYSVRMDYDDRVQTIALFLVRIRDKAWFDPRYVRRYAAKAITRAVDSHGSSPRADVWYRCMRSNGKTWAEYNDARELTVDDRYKRKDMEWIDLSTMVEVGSPLYMRLCGVDFSAIADAHGYSHASAARKRVVKDVERVRRRMCQAQKAG